MMSSDAWLGLAMHSRSPALSGFRWTSASCGSFRGSWGGSEEKPGLLAILADKQAKKSVKDAMEIDMLKHAFAQGMPLSQLWLPERAFGAAPAEAWSCDDGGAAFETSYQDHRVNREEPILPQTLAPDACVTGDLLHGVTTHAAMGDDCCDFDFEEASVAGCAAGGQCSTVALQIQTDCCDRRFWAATAACCGAGGQDFTFAQPFQDNCFHAEGSSVDSLGECKRQELKKTRLRANSTDDHGQISLTTELIERRPAKGQRCNDPWACEPTFLPSDHCPVWAPLCSSASQCASHGSGAAMCCHGPPAAVMTGEEDYLTWAYGHRGPLVQAVAMDCPGLRAEALTLANGPLVQGAAPLQAWAVLNHCPALLAETVTRDSFVEIGKGSMLSSTRPFGEHLAYASGCAVARLGVQCGQDSPKGGSISYEAPAELSGSRCSACSVFTCSCPCGTNLSDGGHCGATSGPCVRGGQEPPEGGSISLQSQVRGSAAWCQIFPEPLQFLSVQQTRGRKCGQGWPEGPRISCRTPLGCLTIAWHALRDALRCRDVSVEWRISHSQLLGTRIGEASNPGPDGQDPCPLRHCRLTACDCRVLAGLDWSVLGVVILNHNFLNGMRVGEAGHPIPAQAGLQAFIQEAVQQALKEAIANLDLSALFAGGAALSRPAATPPPGSRAARRKKAKLKKVLKASIALGGASAVPTAKADAADCAAPSAPDMEAAPAKGKGKAKVRLLVRSPHNRKALAKALARMPLGVLLRRLRILHPQTMGGSLSVGSVRRLLRTVGASGRLIGKLLWWNMIRSLRPCSKRMVPPSGQ